MSDKTIVADKTEKPGEVNDHSEQFVPVTPSPPRSKEYRRSVSSTYDKNQLADQKEAPSSKTANFLGSFIPKLLMKGPEIPLLTPMKQKPAMIDPSDKPGNTSQEADVPIIKKRVNRFELFAMAMPSLFYHNLQTNTSDEVVISSLEERSAISGERMGYKTALGGTFRYRRNLELSAGLIYAWADESFNFTEKTISGYRTTGSNAENTTFSVMPEFSVNNRTVNFRRKELGLQLGASLLLHRGKIFEQSVGGNIAFHRNLINESRTDFNDETIKLKSHFSYVSVFYKLDYRLSRHFDLILQPTFNYASFINENESSPIYIKPNNISVNFGVAYHL